MGVQICPFPPVISMSTQHFGTLQKPNSLLFNLEEEVGCIRPPTPSSQAEVQAACERLQAYTRLPPTGWPSKLLRDVRRFKCQLLREDDRVDVVLLAAMLSEIGYSVIVRCALGGAHAQPGSSTAPGSCFRNLRHEFLFVRCESGEYEGVEMLVDPEFRQQFQIPQPTNNFRQVLQSIPEEFVGTSMRLQPVVELICAEMAASFESRGLTIPPWRRPAAMLSKWLPTKAKDISVDAGGSSPRHASPNIPNNFMSGPQPMLDASITKVPPGNNQGITRVPGDSSSQQSGHVQQLGQTRVCQPQQVQQQQIQPPMVGTQQQQHPKELVINVRRNSHCQSPDVGLKEAAQQLATLALHNQRQASPTYHREQQAGSLQRPQVLQLPALGTTQEPGPTPKLFPAVTLQNVDVSIRVPDGDKADQDLEITQETDEEIQVQPQEQEQEVMVHIRPVDTRVDAFPQPELKQPNFQRVSAPCVLPSFDGQSLLQKSIKLPTPTLSGVAEAPEIGTLCELKRTATVPAPGPFTRLSEPYKTVRPSAQVSLLSAQLASHPASPTANGCEPSTALDWRQKAPGLPLNFPSNLVIAPHAHKRDQKAHTTVEVPTIIPPQQTSPQLSVTVQQGSENNPACARSQSSTNANSAFVARAQIKLLSADGKATGHANASPYNYQSTVFQKLPQQGPSSTSSNSEKTAGNSTVPALPYMSKQQPVHKSQPVIHKVKLQQQNNQQPTAPAV